MCRWALLMEPSSWCRHWPEGVERRRIQKRVKGDDPQVALPCMHVHCATLVSGRLLVLSNASSCQRDEGQALTSPR